MRDAVSDVEALSRERAAEANRKAVDEAAAAILEATRLDLDIQMIGRTSPSVARAAESD